MSERSATGCESRLRVPLGLASSGPPFENVATLPAYRGTRLVNVRKCPLRIASASCMQPQTTQKMNTTAAAVLEDEVSATIRHFRPRPGFIPKSDAHEWRGGGGRVQQREQMAYSSVVYDRNNDVLRLTYLHSPQVASASKGGGRSRICFFLTLGVVVKSRLVTCITCNGPSDDVSAKFQRDVIDPMCSRLSSSADSPSLFSVTSH